MSLRTLAVAVLLVLGFGLVSVAPAEAQVRHHHHHQTPTHDAPARRHVHRNHQPVGKSATPAHHAHRRAHGHVSSRAGEGRVAAASVHARHHSGRRTQASAANAQWTASRHTGPGATGRQSRHHVMAHAHRAHRAHERSASVASASVKRHTRLCQSVGEGRHATVSCR